MTIPLLSSSYFTGEILIQGVHGTTEASIANAYELQMFIAEYEEEYLRRLLGDSFYEEFAAGIAAEVSKWVALKEKIYTAKSYNQTVPVSFADITAAIEFEDVVPAGYILEYVVFDNSTGQDAQISCGSTAGGYDVFQSYGIQPNGLTSIPVGRALSMSAATSLFLNVAQHDDTFNGVSLDMYLVLSPLTSSVPVPTGASTVLFYSPAAQYVYFYYQRNAATQTGMNGESTPNQENATVGLNTSKMVRAWNKMSDKSEVIRQWIYDNPTDYPTFAWPMDGYLGKINTYGV